MYQLRWCGWRKHITHSNNRVLYKFSTYSDGNSFNSGGCSTGGEKEMRKALLLVMISLLALFYSGTVTKAHANSASSPGHFDHIVVIAMENQPEAIMGTSSTP